MRLFLLRTSNKFILEALKRQPENLEKSLLLNRTDLLEGYCTAIAFLWQEDKNATAQQLIHQNGYMSWYDGEKMRKMGMDNREIRKQ